MNSNLHAFVSNSAQVPDEPGCSTSEWDFGDLAFLPPPPPPPPTSQHNVQTHISAEVSVIYTTLNWDWPSMAQHSTALLDTAFATYKCMTDYGHLD